MTLTQANEIIRRGLAAIFLRKITPSPARQAEIDRACAADPNVARGVAWANARLAELLDTTESETRSN